MEEEEKIKNSNESRNWVRQNDNPKTMIEKLSDMPEVMQDLYYVKNQEVHYQRAFEDLVHQLKWQKILIKHQSENEKAMTKKEVKITKIREETMTSVAIWDVWPYTNLYIIGKTSDGEKIRVYPHMIVEMMNPGEVKYEELWTEFKLSEILES